MSVHYFGSFGNAEHVLPVQIDKNGYRAPNINFANRGNWDHIFRPNLINTFNFGYNDILSVKLRRLALRRTLPTDPRVRSTARFRRKSVSRITWATAATDLGKHSPCLAPERPAHLGSGQAHVFVRRRIRWLQDKERNNGNASGTYNFSALRRACAGSERKRLREFSARVRGSASLYVPTLASAVHSSEILCEPHKRQLEGHPQADLQSRRPLGHFHAHARQIQ